MQFSQLAQSVLELDRLLDKLLQTVEPFGIEAPNSQDWFALLKEKLVPQLISKQFLIVAVMGGTNTGKSLVFNHLAGDDISSVDYRASGTKHPVVVFREPVSTAADLQQYFGNFKLTAWENAGQPLEEDHLCPSDGGELAAVNPLFFKSLPSVPEKILLLDTPDIDSDREVNWDRARAVRNAADVILAVLTEQKYNDAAVRKFFREASEADKPILVLFNMFDQESDAAQLPIYLSQFCNETRTNPLAVFTAPFDKEKAVQRTLPFYEYKDNQFAEVNFIEQLTELHFDTIKSQTLRGAMKVIEDPSHGLPSFLRTIEQTAGQFSDALSVLEHIENTTVEWPALPTSLLSEEIRTWWNTERPGWSQSINNAYRTVGKTLTAPLKWGYGRLASKFFKKELETEPPLDKFQMLEQRAVIDLVGGVIKRLEKLAQTDNPVLKREISQWLSGERRSQFLERAKEILQSLEPVNEDFRSALRQRLTHWAEENPSSMTWIRNIDHVATVCRPLITLTLMGSGLVYGGAIVGPAVTDVLIPTVIGEATLQFGADGVSGGAAKMFQEIQADFVQKRSKEFFEHFRDELWLSVIEKLRSGANIAKTETFEQCKRMVNSSPLL